MTPAQLRAIGQTLYGPRWHAALSRDLGVNLRTVQRWERGERGIPCTLSGELDRLMRERRHELDMLLSH